MSIDHNKRSKSILINDLSLDEHVIDIINEEFESGLKLIVDNINQKIIDFKKQEQILPTNAELRVRNAIKEKNTVQENYDKLLEVNKKLTSDQLRMNSEINTLKNGSINYSTKSQPPLLRQDKFERFGNL